MREGQREKQEPNQGGLWKEVWILLVMKKPLETFKQGFI